MPGLAGFFREPAGLRYHGGAVAYACLAWVAGFAGLFHGNPAVNATATLLLAHGMVIAAYLLHECAHNTVFRRQRLNARLGTALTGFCGASYGTFEDIRYKHFQHHVDNDDVAGFDYDTWLWRHPMLTRVIKALFSAPSAPHRGDARWEQEHTFSNPLSLRPAVNWLVLNFGYHNAHHHDMNLPWYRLPAVHRELTGNDPASVIPLGAQVRLYHANRVRRVHNSQALDYPKGKDYLETARTGTGPVGGNAASFLTAF